MNDLIITNTNPQSPLNHSIIEKINIYGLGILDHRHPALNKEEIYEILNSKYYEYFIADALETGHFVITPNGIKIALKTLNEDISVIAGYIFEAVTVRVAR